MNDGMVPDQPLGPFLRDYPLPNGFRHPGVRTTSVLLYSNGSHWVVTANGTVKYGKRPAFGGAPTVCEILNGTFESSLTHQLEARGGASFFDARIDIHWSVDDPVVVARNVVKNVVGALEAPILQRLLDITQRYEIAEAREANAEINRHCANGAWSDLGEAIGLRIRLFVRLAVDQIVIEQVREDRKAKKERERLRERMEQFQVMLAGGRFDQLTYMLSIGSPEDARDFMEKLRQESMADHLRVRDHVLRLVEGGQLHSPDIEALMRELLQSNAPYDLKGSIAPHPPLREPSTPLALDAGPGDTRRTPERTRWWVEEDEQPAQRRRDTTAAPYGTDRYDAPGRPGDARRLGGAPERTGASDRGGAPDFDDVDGFEAAGYRAPVDDDGWPWAGADT